MPKVKYHYNYKSLTYEPVKLTLKAKALRILGLCSAALLFSFIVVVLAFTYIDSPKEKKLKREISQLQLQYEILNDKLANISKVMAELEDRDDNIYRVIFEAEPIPSEIRTAGMGGVNRYKYLEEYGNGQLMKSTAMKLDNIANQMYVQSKSYDKLLSLADRKSEMLSSIPAIQPVRNIDLKRMASGYGWRIDPIYKTQKLHQGMDFTASTGTEIYATGDGVVSKVSSSQRGYGNHIVINHGYGYETLYAHMSRFKAREGQRVKRGEVIGYVGNTGKSVGPHLHYEVHKNGVAINPVNFYYNDLTPEQFEEMISLSAKTNQALD